MKLCLARNEEVLQDVGFASLGKILFKLWVQSSINTMKYVYASNSKTQLNKISQIHTPTAC